MMLSKNSASVIIFAVVASDGMVILPFFIKAEFKTNREYMNILLARMCRYYDATKIMLVKNCVLVHGPKQAQTNL